MGDVINIDAYRIRRAIENNVLGFLEDLTCDQLFERLVERELYLAEKFAEVSLEIISCRDENLRLNLEKDQERLLNLLQDYGPFEACPCG